MPNKKEITCVNCSKVKTVFDHNRRPTIYCSHQCSADYKRKIFIDQWLAEEINGTYKDSKTGGLHRRIVGYYKENINNCEICGIDKIWCDKVLTFEIDHIDGDRTNNYFSNLRYICPNCHSQTPTFRAKNMKHLKK